MVFAAPEFVIAQPVELLDEVEVPAELQHRIFADRMMRREEGAELEPLHGRNPDSIGLVISTPIMPRSGYPQEGPRMPDFGQRTHTRSEPARGR